MAAYAPQNKTRWPNVYHPIWDSHAGMTAKYTQDDGDNQTYGGWE